MQETKSQSLDTPYAHSHEQHKLDMDGDDMAERSHSFTAITHVARDKGMPHFVDCFSLAIPASPRFTGFPHDTLESQDYLVQLF